MGPWQVQAGSPPPCSGEKAGSLQAGLGTGISSPRSLRQLGMLPNTKTDHKHKALGVFIYLFIYNLILLCSRVNFM